METAIIILQQNNADSKELPEFRTYAKKYIGMSRYKDENDDPSGYRNAIIIDGNLSDKEKKHLMDYSKNLFVFFLEGEDILESDTNTIKSQTNENN